jgi:hypothetical protein
MCSREQAPVAGRPLPNEEVNAMAAERVPKRDTLRQPTLFEFGVRETHGHTDADGFSSNNERDNFASPENSLQWGDVHEPGEVVESTGIFRVLSHNVNGLSTFNDHEDVRSFARTMKDKGVAVFGLQETNRNFERKKMVDSFHNVIRGSANTIKDQ